MPGRVLIPRGVAQAAVADYIVLYADSDGALHIVTVEGDTVVNAAELSALIDVLITSPNADDYLKFNGVKWVNAAFPSSGTPLGSTLELFTNYY